MNKTSENFIGIGSLTKKLVKKEVINTKNKIKNVKKNVKKKIKNIKNKAVDLLNDDDPEQQSYNQVVDSPEESIVELSDESKDVEETNNTKMILIIFLILLAFIITYLIYANKINLTIGIAIFIICLIISGAINYVTDASNKN
jgi:flagellar biosynthesis protein FliP